MIDEVKTISIWRQTMRLKAMFALVFAVAVLYVISHLINKIEGRMTYQTAIASGLYMIHFPVIFWGEVLTLFSGLIILAWLLKIRFSLWKIVSSLPLSLMGALVMSFGAVGAGKHPTEYFCDGFAERARSVNITTQSLNWANMIFADKTINPKNSEAVKLNTDKIPSFFTSLFGTNNSLDAIVYYDKHGKAAEGLEVSSECGYQRGVFITRGFNSVPVSPALLSQRVADNFFVFIYFYK